LRHRQIRVDTAAGVITSLTDSAGIAANISDETGSGLMVFATTPTFTDDPIIDGTTPSLTIGDGGMEDAQLNINGSAQDWSLGIDDTDDDFKICLGTALGTTCHIIIDEAGIISKPLQSGFAVLSSAMTNIADNTTILWGSERFDQNADFNLSTETFTAPVTGQYDCDVILNMENVDTAWTFVGFNLETSNDFYFVRNDFGPWNSDPTNWTTSVGQTVDMSASDTMIVTFQTGTGGTIQEDISANETFWSCALTL